MSRILNCYKQLGETPRERLERLCRDQPEFQDTRLTYLGRLDPLAEGVLLIGVDVDQRQRELVLALPKEYRLTVLFGFATDTYDVLGKLTDAVTRDRHPRVRLDGLLGSVAKIPGRRTQQYPAYSAQPVTVGHERKPLHAWARAGRIDDIEAPARDIEIYDCRLISMQQLEQKELARDITRMIRRVRGDFRQEELLATWQEHLRGLHEVTFDAVTLVLTVSSGTYVRALAHELGRLQEVPALAYHIVRTRVGTYGIDEAMP